jgi:hypothetical protein
LPLSSPLLNLQVEISCKSCWWCHSKRQVMAWLASRIVMLPQDSTISNKFCWVAPKISRRKACLTMATGCTSRRTGIRESGLTNFLTSKTWTMLRRIWLEIFKGHKLLSTSSKLMPYRHFWETSILLPHNLRLLLVVFKITNIWTITRLCLKTTRRKLNRLINQVLISSQV